MKLVIRCAVTASLLLVVSCMRTVPPDIRIRPQERNPLDELMTELSDTVKVQVAMLKLKTRPADVSVRVLSNMDTTDSSFTAVRIRSAVERAFREGVYAADRAKYIIAVQASMFKLEGRVRFSLHLTFSERQLDGSYVHFPRTHIFRDLPLSEEGGLQAGPPERDSVFAAIGDAIEVLNQEVDPGFRAETLGVWDNPEQQSAVVRSLLGDDARVRVADLVCRLLPNTQITQVEPGQPRRLFYDLEHADRGYTVVCVLETLAPPGSPEKYAHIMKVRRTHEWPRPLNAWTVFPDPIDLKDRVNNSLLMVYRGSSRLDSAPQVKPGGVPADTLLWKFTWPGSDDIPFPPRPTYCRETEELRLNADRLVTDVLRLDIYRMRTPTINYRLLDSAITMWENYLGCKSPTLRGRLLGEWGNEEKNRAYEAYLLFGRLFGDSLYHYQQPSLSTAYFLKASSIRQRDPVAWRMLGDYALQWDSLMLAAEAYTEALRRSDARDPHSVWHNAASGLRKVFYFAGWSDQGRRIETILGISQLRPKVVSPKVELSIYARPRDTLDGLVRDLRDLVNTTDTLSAADSARGAWPPTAPWVIALRADGRDAIEVVLGRHHRYGRIEGVLTDRLPRKPTPSDLRRVVTRCLIAVRRAKT